MTPGIMIMTTLFGGVYGGTTVLWDRRLGFLNKLLAAPIPRAAVPLGKLAGMMVQSWIQVVIILIVALFFDVRIATGLPGVLFMIGMASLFGILMGGISLSLAANLKSIETLFAVMNFLTLPLMFTSNAIFPLRAMPPWLQAIAVVNPLTYAVTPMRIAATQGWLWDQMWLGVLVLAVMAVLSITLAITQFNRTIG
jgi:ABC-2 type transport system permease protein